MYKFFYYIMLLGYFGVSFQSSDTKTKFVGLLLLIVNAILFYK